MSKFPIFIVLVHPNEKSGRPLPMTCLSSSQSQKVPSGPVPSGPPRSLNLTDPSALIPSLTTPHS